LSRFRDVEVKLRRLFNLRWHWVTLRMGVRNLWRFRGVVWRFDTCDYSYMLELMGVAANEMSRGFRERGHCVDAPRRARELAVMSALCNRLAADDYCLMTRDWKRAEFMANRDVKRLGRVLQKVRCWWD
jgi:hypothetical protein